MEILGQSTKAMTQHPYVHLGYLAASNREFFMIPLIPGLLLLLAGSFQLYFRKKRYFKTSIASIIIGLLFIAMAICFFFDKPNIPTKIISLTNLKGLSTPMTIYAQEYDGKLPNSENWCDLLVMKMDVYPDTFSSVGRDLQSGESAYALNENIINMKFSEIPANVVLLFETNLGVEEERTGSVLSRDYVKSLGIDKDYKVFQSCWNQVGGTEDITTEYHRGEGTCVLFSDGHTEFVKTEDIPKLKWHPEESEMPLEESE